MTKITKMEWVSHPPITSPEHEELVRELMSYHNLCSTCCVLETDASTGRVEEQTPNSALHWSRVFEWPWAILNGELSRDNSKVIDAAGGHAVLQYALAKRSFSVVNVDLNTKSLRAVDDGIYTILNQGHYINLYTAKGDIGDLWYSDNLFTHVMCISVLEHIPNWYDVFQELLRVLAPGGIMILTFDVVVNMAANKDFNIDTVAAEKFITMLGGEYIPPNVKTLLNLMSCGTVLAALCLKIVKE